MKSIAALRSCYLSRVNPTFLPTSYGFRKGKGCHDALKKGHRTFNGCAWMIKADVKAFFDEVDHQVLIKLLKKRISDERFINLIWKLLRCGYMENGQLHKPQGSVINAHFHIYPTSLVAQDCNDKRNT